MVPILWLRQPTRLARRLLALRQGFAEQYRSCRRLRGSGLKLALSSLQRNRVVAMIISRVLDPGSRLATARGLARQHLKSGALVLYDLTSVYLEGRQCPLAQRGHSRDPKRGKLQIELPRRESARCQCSSKTPHFC